jgi:hypothetical protein
MIHFLFFLVFASFIAVAFAIFTAGDARTKFFHGAKIFAEFVGISLVLAWIFYFLPI